VTFNPDNPQEHSLKFQPKTDEEIKRAGLVDPGTYDFEVMGAEDKTSKKGNPMTVVILKVFVGERTREMKDYLLEVFPKKLKHFAYGIGMAKGYDDGYLDPRELVGKCGKVVVGVEDDPQYGTKNVIEDYVVPGKEAPAPKKAALPPQPTVDEPPF
jgi:hypothetical protein